jgi:hypothetical protein
MEIITAFHNGYFVVYNNLGPSMDIPFERKQPVLMMSG